MKVKPKKKKFNFLPDYISSMVWGFSLLLSIYTLIVYTLSYLLIFSHWIAGFLMMSLPIAQFLVFATFLYWLIQRPKRALLPFAILVIGYGFYDRTYAKNNPLLSLEKDFSLLTYNAYGMFSGYSNPNDKGLKELKLFLGANSSEIKCFQEFYFNEGRKEYENLQYLTKNTPYYINKAFNQDAYDQGEEMGLAIFSKYPIIKHGGDEFENSTNGYLWADININGQVIKVINVQLYSMSIRLGNVTNQLKIQNYDVAGTESRGILSSLKKGFIFHKKEIDVLNEIIRESPYPVILTGDLNETPYGYVYGTLRERMENAFETAGRGYGFTLARAPYFIRIDNQFYTKEIAATRFETLSDIKFSDHYPILGDYKLREE